MSIVIKAENISKKYLIGRKKNAPSPDLRETLTKLVYKIVNPFSYFAHTADPIYEEFWALKDVSFDIKQGERIGIIGRNGAGKSTILKILSRITEPTAGRITIKGRVASLLEVGTGFHPDLTGRENIYLNGAILGMSRAEIRRKFDEIVDFAEVERFLDTPVKHYSSGMYVRLAFAVAAHLEPEILIVDEVLAVGDALFQKKCLGKMEDVGREGRTVLFVSHNMTSIKALCEKGILLEQGGIMYYGDVIIATERYLSSFSKTNDRSVLIANRKRDRKCSLRARIIDVSIFTENEVNPCVVDSKSPIIIRMTVEAQSEISCSAQIVICDELQALSYLDSATLQNKMYRLNNGISTIECKVMPLNLYSGRYKIRCGLVIPYKEVIDEVDDAYRFDVNEFDPYDTGFNISRSYGFGIFHIDHKWADISQGRQLRDLR